MICPTLPADAPAIVSLAEGTGVFKPMEMKSVGQMQKWPWVYVQAWRLSMPSLSRPCRWLTL
jgi:hypothetical protein